MKLLTSLLAAGGLFALGSSASAQYVPNFNTYNASFSLSGQDSWDTNDTNQANFVGVVNGYTTTTDNWALIGGLVVNAASKNATAPTAATNDLYRNFTLPTGGAVFSATMGIASSQTPQTGNDTFSWKFQTSGGADIVSLDFVPTSGALKSYWTSNGVQTSALNGAGIAYNAKYDIFATVSGLGTGAAHLQVTLDPVGPSPAVTVIDTPLSASLAASVGRVTASWKLADTTQSGGVYTNYGNNALIFQNYSVVAVPEPAVVGLLGLAGVALVLRARKRRI